MLIIFLLIAPSTCQFASYISLRLRLPGRCREGDFDCGFGHCIPVRNFHDGRADCMDGSDEWCLFGQVRCGAYCVDLKDGFGCLFSSKCDGSSKQPKFCEHSKEKLCRESQSFPCKGYGECVLWQNLMDGQHNCIDGSDEDSEYVRSLEGPFRCYFNRTKQPQPQAVIIYPSHLSLTPPPLVPAPPLCTRCPPPPFVFPTPLPIQPTAQIPQSFPTLIPSNETESNQPILPVSHYSTLPSHVHISHITPATQSEPNYGDLFLKSSTPYPTKIDYTVEAHIKTVLPATTAATVSSIAHGEYTSAKPQGWTTDAFAHIKVVSDSGKNKGGEEATHIDIGTGEIIYGGSTLSTNLQPVVPITTEATKPTITATSIPNTAPSDLADGIFFPLPVHPVNNRPVAIRPISPYIFHTLRPIVPQATPDGTTDYGSPEHLIPIQPGIAIPTAYPDGRSTTPKYPFPSDEEYEGEIYGKTGPTVKVGVVTTEGTVASSLIPSNASSTDTLYTAKTPLSSTTNKIIWTESSQASSTEPISTQSTENTSSIPSVDIVPDEGVQTKNTDCPDVLLESLKERYPSPYCRCESANSTECQYASKTILKVGSDTICDDNSAAADEDKARIILSMTKNSLPFPACIDNDHDNGIIVSVTCPGCTLQQIQSAVDKYNSGPIHVHFEALNSSICSLSSLNNCHKYANCVVDSSGLRFHCVCKNGTTDISGGKGTDCFGFPSENDCIMIFRVCLIFWLLILLGLLFCCPLVYWMYYQLADIQRRSTAVHPIQNVEVKPKVTASPKIVTHKISTASSRSAMASVLVDALRNNAKGISAVSHSMTTKEKVRFTDEVTCPPSAADWRPLPDPNMEPPPGIIRTPGMTPSASETRLNEAGLQTASPVQSLAGTPVGIAETPILDQPRNADSFGGTPRVERSSVHSLPVPSIEVPQTHKTSLDVNQMQTPRQAGPSSPSPVVVTADVHQENQIQDSHSLVSVGVQPTIWETYRAVGVIGADRGREDSSSSLDDLIGKKFPESQPESKVSRKEEKSIEIPVPKLDLIPSAPEAPLAVENKQSEDITEKKTDSPQAVITTTSVARKKSSASLKLAEMLGVTLDDQNDMQALSEMATKKIDLPLEPISIPTEHLTQLEQDLITLDQDNKKKISDAQALEDAVLKELQEEEKIKKDLKHMMPEQKENENKSPFVPAAARKMSGGRKAFDNFLTIPRRGEQNSSTEDSDAEILFQRRMEAIRREGKESNPFKDRKRRYRRPERQLSSISEKSAEIASDAAIMEHSSGDFTVSAPNTTRSLSDWHAFIPKHRRFDDSTTEDTDADIPSWFKRTSPIIGSPEIPDVTKRRSRERLDMLDSARSTRKMEKVVASTSSKTSTSAPLKIASTKKSFLPQISRKSTANSRTSLDSKGRASIVSRKIATRKTEMRSSKSASDLTVEQQEILSRGGILSRREKIARSEEFLGKKQRPPWDYSPYRDGNEKPLPPIHHRSTYSLRSLNLSPAPVKRRTVSHSPIHTARSGSSVSLSRYFDPREPYKPPKEELWWTPHD